MVIMLVEISKKIISMNTKKFLSALKETELYTDVNNTYCSCFNIFQSRSLKILRRVERGRIIYKSESFLYLQILRIVISRPENAIEIHINRIKTISVLQIEAVGSKKNSKLSTNP